VGVAVQGAARLCGRTAVITGAANGIGRATVERFLREGATVVAGDLNAANGACLADDVAREGYADAFRFVRADVALEADVAALIDIACSAFGGVDVVFNNAGIAGAIGPVVETEVEHWDQTFAVMARGVFLGIKHGARAMIRQCRGGAIVNTASIAALRGGAGPLAYSATKAAVVSMTQNAACELAEYGIRVNAVCPGMILTSLMHRGRVAEAEAVVREIQPLPVLGAPEHIAAAVLYLASDEAAFVTGEAHVVDGGYLAQGLLAVHPLPGAERRPTYSGITYGNTGLAPRVRRLSTDGGRHG
jgi:NAD(P)-dependent dehydrogenase (short-subunit alcohol dehydrogenase family)